MRYSCDLMMECCSKCLGGHTFHDYNSTVSDHCNPVCHGHLSSFLDVEHHVLLFRIFFFLHNIYSLHNIVMLAFVKHHIVAAEYASLYESDAVLLSTSAVCFAQRF